MKEDVIQSKEEMKRHTRRSFVVAGLSMLAGYEGFRWLLGRRNEEGVQWPLRNVLETNGGIWQDLFKESRLAKSSPPPAGKPPRFNGDLGLDSNFDPTKWKLKIVSPTPVSPDEDEDDTGSLPAETVKELSMSDLKWLPQVSTSTEFKCIEGWSDVISYSGIRFSDFLKHYGLGTRSGAPADLKSRADDIFPYVGLETPDKKYYVSIDMESMLHPQTLLAFEMNGQPLSPENGAPLRLIIPVKYGIKSLKRIGTIRFSDSRPPDYWAERGYDWFAGL
jgi:hypothetical protein